MAFNRIAYLTRTTGKFAISSVLSPFARRYATSATEASAKASRVDLQDKKVGIVLFKGVEEVDFAAPLSAVGTWGIYYGGPKKHFTVSEHGEVVCAKGLAVKTDYTFEAAPQSDYLIIPGGQGTRQERDNPRLLEFVKAQAEGAEQVLSVCTGSLILASAGLLDDKRATTHWKAFDLLKASEKVNVVPAKFTRDGKFWTAAGMTSGIDLLLAFIAQSMGEDVAAQVQRHLEYFPGAVYGDVPAHAEHLKYLGGEHSPTVKPAELENSSGHQLCDS